MSTSRTPTVGRIVHLFPGNAKNLQSNGLGPDDPVAAVIVRVWGGGLYPTLNLMALVDGTSPVWVTSVQHASSAGAGSTRWDWPPLV